MSKRKNTTKIGQTQGGGGALFARPDNIRSDARTIAQMVAAGVIPEEQATGLIRGVLGLLASAIQQGNARNVAALMRAHTALIKLEQDERFKAIDKAIPDKHDHRVQHSQLQVYLPEKRGQSLPITNGNGSTNGHH